MAVKSGIDRLALRILLIVVLVGISPAVVSAAEFVEFYKSGIAAVESQHWTLAAEMMQRAIDDQPEARTRVKRALYFRRYLPHFYLGQSLYETGDCSGALIAWQESESQGVVKRFPEYQQILEGRLACDQMVGLESALSKATRAVESAARSAVQSRRRLAELPSSEAAAQGLMNRQSEAEASLRRARQRLASVDIVLDEVEEASTLVAIAQAEFEAIGRRADGLRSTARATRQQKVVVQIEDLVARARAELKSSEYLDPYPDAVARSRAAVEQALQRAEAVSDSSLSPGELQTIQAELGKVTTDLRRAVSPPPAVLQEAANAYMARDYSGVLKILDGREFASARASSHSHLLRAAALFSLYYTTGVGDNNLLEQAGDEVQACLRAGRSQSPSVALFPPSFVAFFESQVLEPAGSGEEERADRGR